MSYLIGKGISEQDAIIHTGRLIVKVPDPKATPQADPELEEFAGGASDGEVIAVGEVSKAVKTDTIATPLAEGVYVVSISGRKRRLHQIGRCYRRPHVDYATFEVFGTTCPEASAYHSCCQHCWPKTSTQPKPSRPSSSVAPHLPLLRPRPPRRHLHEVADDGMS